MVLWKQGSDSNGFRDIQPRQRLRWFVVYRIQWWMWHSGSRDLKRPLSQGQSHSFRYQSISYIGLYDFGLPIGCQYNFCSTTHRLATIHNVTDRQTTLTDATQ